MKPNDLFLGLPKNFWANVRLISQQVGYTDKRSGQIKIPTKTEIETGLRKVDIDFRRVAKEKSGRVKFDILLSNYFEYRANALNTYVEPKLMTVERAKRTYENYQSELRPTCPIPMNKQTGSKKAPAYLTGLVNMLIEANAKGAGCDYDPRQLTIITRDGIPVRTLARRVDGAFPSSVNPIAIWEIKEYYYTTTFGSRVADGIYETLLDGLELEELRNHEGINVRHYLIVDAYGTWWNMGKSYLCRIIDMLHMGYIDEVLFGYEVVERLPLLVKEWFATETLGT